MRSVLLTAVGLLAAGGLGAQQLDWQAGAVAVVSGTKFAGAGGGLGWRTSARTRLRAFVLAGDVAEEFGGRVEATFSYYVNPLARRIGPYAGGGLAVTTTGSSSVEYLSLFFGLEGNPRGRVRWFGEAGVSGGFRVAFGVRLRT